MDYEKAYKEALKRADTLTEKYGGRDFAEYVFPELAESEDDRMIKAITHILYENYTDAAVIEGVEIAEIVTWLEERKDHLRDTTKKVEPHWKPSEEQLEALERASTNKYLSAKQYDILVSLYEQLKKLKEGQQ